MNSAEDVDKKPKLEELSVKDRKKARKMSKSNYEISADAKKLWEELRRLVTWFVEVKLIQCVLER